MVTIVIKTIPHKEQKYDTAGDYYWQDNEIAVRISRMDNRNYEFAIALHELLEIHLCLRDRIPLEWSTNFDLVFEKERAEGKHKDTNEPGDDPRCPYFKQHQMASRLEKYVIRILGEKWVDYDKATVALSNQRVVNNE
jgi:hypothetical protein